MSYISSSSCKLCIWIFDNRQKGMLWCDAAMGWIDELVGISQGRPLQFEIEHFIGFSSFEDCLEFRVRVVAAR